MGKDAYRPWLKPFGYALALLTLGGACLWAVAKGYAEGQLRYVGFAVGLLGLLVGMKLLERSQARWDGQQCEREAAKGLEKRLRRHPWRVELGVPVDGLGDADVLLTTDNLRLVLEIKSNRQIRVQRPGLIRKNSSLTARDGSKFVRDPIAQVTALANSLSAHAVIWFPRSDEQRVDILKPEGVCVIQGSVDYLVKQLGLAPNWLERLTARKPVFPVLSPQKSSD